VGPKGKKLKLEQNMAREGIMEWTTPQFEEVSLNCEISSYASAEL
jgi:coenzyme PQQ precursor peptide PqqA